VTVCVATLFRWNYGTVENPVHGIAAITASDRMITAGDIQYEPNQLKAAFFDAAVILIAGDYTVHSEAIKETRRQIASIKNASPKQLALIYGQAIQSTKRRQAEDLYLAPLGLNTDTFIAQQREMSGGSVDLLMNQLQTYHGDDVEGLVVASNGSHVELYHVDNKGTCRNYDDVGFAAIGVGGYHARSSLMQVGYVNTATLSTAVAFTYAAKKRAEVAPGVGKATDMHIVFRDAVTPIWPEVFTSLQSIYDSYAVQATALAVASVEALEKSIFGVNREQPTQNEQADKEPDKDDAVGGGNAPATPEAAASDGDEKKNDQ
jgi:hypothetical protein